MRQFKNSNGDIIQDYDENSIQQITCNEEDEESELSSVNELSNQNMAHLKKLKYFEALRTKNKSQNCVK